MTVYYGDGYYHGRPQTFSKGRCKPQKGSHMDKNVAERPTHREKGPHKGEKRSNKTPTWRKCSKNAP